MSSFFEQFLSDLRHTGPLEAVAVASGIGSVWFSRKEHILVYPVGLVSTVIYIYISLKGHLPGEAAVNLYYTGMSFWGWWLWTRRNARKEPVLHITYSGSRELRMQFLFFLVCYALLFLSITLLKKEFNESIPWADSLASAAAFTGMWLMARKKVESWYWWIATNIASVPLYAVKGYALSAVYYVVLLAMAFWGLAEWRKRAGQAAPAA
jgi:nicotinamide mononucleotide transporter